MLVGMVVGHCPQCGFVNHLPLPKKLLAEHFNWQGGAQSDLEKDTLHCSSLVME